MNLQLKDVKASDFFSSLLDGTYRDTATGITSKTLFAWYGK
jgi:hypothetical protein